MAKSFRIEFTKPAYRNRILDEIKEQLTYNPDEETRNKKILRENPIADWELRIHPFRVFYETDPTSRRVRILAIGIKERENFLSEERR